MVPGRLTLLSQRYLESGCAVLFHISSFSFLFQDFLTENRIPPQLALPNGNISIGLPISRLRPPADAGNLSHASGSEGAHSREPASPPTELERLNQLRQGPIIVYASKTTGEGLRSPGGVWWPLACLFAVSHLCLFAAFLKGSPDKELRSGMWIPARLSFSSGFLYILVLVLDGLVFISFLRAQIHTLRVMRIAATAFLALQLFFTLSTLLDLLMWLCTSGLLLALVRLEDVCTSHIFCVYP